MTDTLFPYGLHGNPTASQFHDAAPSQEEDPMDAETTQGSAAPVPPTVRAKRARFDPTVATPGEKSLAPLDAAEKHIVGHCESLREGIANLLSSRGREFITLCHKRFHRETARVKLETTDTLIPVSARVNFRLNVCKEAEQLPELLELKDLVKTTVEKHQLDLKAHIIASIKIECSALQLAVNKHLCYSLFNVTTLFLLAQGVDSTRVHATVLSLLDTHGNVLLAHNSLDPIEFQAIYKTTLGVECGTDAPVYQPAGNLDSIKRAIEAVFVESWSIYKSQWKENELSLSLKKEAKATLLSEKTEAATMQIDTELPVDREQLQELIRKEATKLSKELITKEIQAQLKPSSKGKRGQPNGASGKKKSNGRTVQRKKKKKQTNNNATNQRQGQPSNEQANARTRSRRNQRARRAEGAANGTQTVSANRQGNRSRQRSRANGAGMNRGLRQS